MSYEKTNWKTGDVITSTKLNHMEDGIAGMAGYDININYDVIFDGSIPYTDEEVFASADIEDAIKSTFDVYDLQVWFDESLTQTMNWSFEQATSGSIYNLYLDENNTLVYANSIEKFMLEQLTPDYPTKHALKIVKKTVNGYVSDEFKEAVLMAVNS